MYDYLNKLNKLYEKLNDKETLKEALSFDAVFEAWKQGKEHRRKNDYTDGKSIYFHGNEIVRGTPTTKERLNTVLRDLVCSNCYFYTELRQMYLAYKGKSYKVDINQWIHFKNGELVTELPEKESEKEIMKRYRQIQRVIDKAWRMVETYFKTTNESLQDKIYEEFERLMKENLGVDISIDDFLDFLYYGAKGEPFRKIYLYYSMDEMLKNYKDMVKRDFKYFIKRYLQTGGKII